MKLSTILNSGLTSMQRWLSDSLDNTDQTNAGVRVTTKSAAGYPPVWYAINKIGGHVGVMPLTVRRRLERGSEPARTHAAYRLLKTRPNRLQTACSFKESITAHALLMRSGRAAIVRDPSTNKPVELLLLSPDRTCTVLHEGQKWHLTNIETDEPLAGRIGDESRFNYVLPDEDVLHIPGLSWNGVDGLSLLDIARESFGLGLGGQKATARNFKNQARPGVILEAPAGLFRTDDEAQEFLDNFNQAHQGLDEAGKAGLLREGMKVQTLPISAKDAEWLEQRKFERQDTALLFLLETILGDDSSVSYNSQEQKNLAYLSNCLLRWMTRWEQECDEKLLSEKQKARDTHFFKFNEKALLRADANTQMATFSGYLQNRVMSPNEVREKLDLLPYDGGDTYENPNITPGAADDGADDDTPPADDDPSDMGRRAVAIHCRHLVADESRRIVNAAGGRSNFVGWCDSFYQHWPATLSAAIVAFGVDQAAADRIAADHCQQSFAAVLECTDTATPDNLKTSVEALTQSWPERGDTLAATILKG